MSKGDRLDSLTAEDLVSYCAGFGRPKSVGFVDSVGVKAVVVRHARTGAKTTIKGGRGWVKRLTGPALVEALEKLRRPDPCEASEPVFATVARDLRSVPKEDPPARSRAYLDFVKTFVCADPDCEEWPVDPHHWGKHAAGQKCSDYETAPACRPHHDLVTGTVNGTTGCLPGLTRAETEVVFLRASVRILGKWAERLEKELADYRLRDALDEVSRG